jgi:subtilisin family serine protease
MNKLLHRSILLLLLWGFLPLAARAEETPIQPAVYVIQLTTPALASPARSLGKDLDQPTALAAIEQSQRTALQSIERALGRPVESRGATRYALNSLFLLLTETEAARVRLLPGVAAAAPEHLYLPDTDAGPRWIGAPGLWDGSASGGLGSAKGEGMIIGVLDSGINRDHPAFADVGGDGYNHTNPRSKYYGVCDPAHLSYNPAFACNDKLIGAYLFSANGNTGPEDETGHGSHTASTAAGNVVRAGVYAQTAPGVSPTYIGLTTTISGVAPHAHLIVYDVCAATCAETNILQAIDQAVLDGVDVINYSISGAPDPYSDPIGLAFLSARQAGIVVAASAGNKGPAAGSLGPEGHNEPWVITVGAGSHDRTYAVALTPSGGVNPPGVISGRSKIGGPVSAPVVLATAVGGYPAHCNTAAAPGSFSGKIVVCERAGETAMTYKGSNVQKGGAVGVIIVNSYLTETVAAAQHFLPAANLSLADGQTLKAWIAANPGVTLTLSIGAAAPAYLPALGDAMYTASSRGPAQVPHLLKPDLLAPGVDILAAMRTAANTYLTEFAFYSGTSMAVPHVSGAAALLLQLHPAWTPGQVQSALMTTAWAGVWDGSSAADAFDMGAGRVDLTQASRVGLTLDVNPAEFLASNPATGGNPGALNLPSLQDNACALRCVWTRTVRSTLAQSVTWDAAVSGAPSLGLTVSPASFTLAPGAAQTLTITAHVGALPNGGWVFNQVVLTPRTAGIPAVRLPLAVLPETKWVFLPLILR